MYFNCKTTGQLLLLTSALSAAQFANADFLNDSKAKLDLRNFYMNRDFRQSNAPQNKAEEWAQGFLLRVESGYTDGPIGFGVDALGFMGVKLDSSPDRFGTGLLKGDSHRRAQDEYGEVGLLAKARWSKTDLKYGTQEPQFPALIRNDARLLPQTFRGAWLNTREIDNLTLDLARYDRVNYRDSSDNQDMTVFNGGKRNIALGQQKTSDQMLVGGGRYQLTPDLAASYYYGGLEKIYRQHLVNIVHTLPLGPGESFKTDLRYARSLSDGGSNIDNTAIGALFTYKIGAQNISAGYQRMSGATGFAYVNGADNALINLVQLGDFGNQNEHSWQIRHDYDFAGLGIPGLTLMNRYLNGDNVDRGAGLSEGKTWERNTVLSYVIQSGTFKNVGITWRNASARSNYLSDIDENRLILTYSVPLW